MTSSPRFNRQALPKGWIHPRLRLHRAWYARRTWQWRARAGLTLTVVLLVVVIAFNLNPWWLLLALLPAMLPTPVRPEEALREVEKLSGAYTTALTAPEDAFGFQERLERQALYTQRQTDLPALPWLEGAAILALCSLLLVFPPRAAGTDATTQRPVTRDELARSNGVLPDGGGSDAQPVLDAPSRGAAPGGGTSAKPGRAANGGSLPESQLGDLKPGGGNANDDPAAISKEFMDALERGSVRERDPNAAQGGKDGKRVQDNNPGAGQPGSAKGDGNADPSSGNDGSQSGQNGKTGQNGNRSGQGKSNGGSRNQPGGTQRQGGSQTDPNGAQNQQGNGNQPGSGSQSGGKQPGAGKNGRGNQPSAGDDPSEQFNDGKGQNGQSPRGQPGRGGRGSSEPKQVGAANGGKGKLQYLPGAVKGTNVRSGALQLPGDPRQPLTGTPGTPNYQRATESAILDPKLPPEYQELLKNYYK